MAITTLDDILEFLDLDTAYFVITPSNNVLNFTSSSGGPVDITLTDGNYDGVTLASHLQTQMNANTTLTGTGTITFAISYSTTTRKFTINSGTGKTVAYTHTSSDAGLTFGFTANKTAAQTIVSDIEAGDPSQIVSSIKDSTETLVSEYCNRIFEETSYTCERYDGNNKGILTLKNFPVTAVDKVSIGTLDVIQISNSNQTSTASVSATTTGLRLVLDGTADTSITYAANATMTAVVNAVNALGNGWAARLNSSIYGNFKSTEIIPRYGLNAIDTNWVDLSMVDDPLDDIDVYLERGQILKYGGWPKGTRNIYIDYTAGFTSDNMPNDLKLAVKILVKFFYNKMDDDSYGVEEYRAHNLWASFNKEETIPKEAKMILMRYKRFHT
ncbi:MAG: hypothetical protein WC055_00360 [Melioribacteraceae bacterium]